LHKKLEKLCSAQKFEKIVHCTKNQKNCAQKFEKIVQCTKNQKNCAQKFEKIVQCTKNQKNCAQKIVHKKLKKLCIAQKIKKIVHKNCGHIIQFLTKIFYYINAKGK
jgi:Glu-tRNA(Gln) amidotransferase subunit E-like FAD-binding protein